MFLVKYLFIVLVYYFHPLLFSLVQVQNQSFGPKQNAKFTVDPPTTHPPTHHLPKTSYGAKIQYVGLI